MKRILLAVLTCMLVASLSYTSVPPASATISSYGWIGEHFDYDPYWDNWGIIAFEEGSTATFYVRIYNNWGYLLNVSMVAVYLDWNQNYTSTGASETAPSVMPSGTYRTFLITFTVPDVTVASNLFSHSYNIFVEHVNSTGDPLTYPYSVSAASGFNVYSNEQRECMRSYEEVGTIFDQYGTNPSFSSTNASLLWKEGYRLYLLAYSKHQNGGFVDAMNYYDDAKDNLEAALALEGDYDTEMQEYNDDLDRQWNTAYLQEEWAYVNKVEAEANATRTEAEATLKLAEAQMTLAQATLMQGYAWIVFGIGFIIFGIAAVLWANKRHS